MKKGKMGFVAIVFTFVLGLTSISPGWDYNAEFSITNGNPNGVWTYGTIDKTTGAFLPYLNPVSAAPNDRWESNTLPTVGPDADGCVTKDQGSGSSHPEWLPGQSWYPYMTGMMSPLSRRDIGTGARFTAPTPGTYSVTIVFENRVIKGFTTEVYVNVNGGRVWESTVTGFQSGPENFATFVSAVALSAGGTIDFFDGSDDNPAEDHNGGDHLVGVTAMITLVSSPVEPTQNLVMKLDAGAGVKDSEGQPIGIGGIVGIWEDQANGGLLDAITRWGTPTLESGTFPNGSHNVIRFTGDDGLVIYDLSDPDDRATFLDPEDPNDRGPLSLTTYTVYVVGKLNQTANTSQAFFSNFNEERGYVMGISDIIPDYVKFWTNGGGEMRSDGAIDDTGRYYLLTGTITQLLGKKLYVNDCVEAEGFGLSTYTDATVVSVGALGNGSQFLKGDIAEIRVYDGFIEATHLSVVNELASKYGLNRECLAGPDPDKAALTALTLFGTTENGTTRYDERWNTLWPDAAWDIAVASGSIAELAADPENIHILNIYDNMNIYIQMEKGQEYTFTFATPTTGADPGLYYGMNFFFDNAEKLGQAHGISVFANVTDPGESPEFFQANSATTMGWPITDVPGAGTLIYKDFAKGLSVTLTDWVMYHPTVFNVDLLTNQNAGAPEVPDTHALTGPDGNLDNLGQFTLRVDSYQMTCEDQKIYPAMDFNQDCYVNLADFAEFAQDWLKCNDPQNVECTDQP